MKKFPTPDLLWTMQEGRPFTFRPRPVHVAVALSSLAGTLAALSALVVGFRSLVDLADIKASVLEDMRMFRRKAAIAALFRPRRRRQIDDNSIQGTASPLCQCAAPGSNRCPAGPPGITGAPGADGLPGPAGQPGKTGKDGMEALTTTGPDECQICPAGPQGLPGISGPLGAPGTKGRPGTDAPALDSVNGRPGEPGDPGPPGTDGTNGIPGPPGRDGTNGLRSPGRKGLSGFSGPPGFPGRDGINVTGVGPAGPAGPAGLVGIQGIDGEPGRTGELGDIGGPGNDGQYCPCPDRSFVFQRFEAEPREGWLQVHTVPFLPSSTEPEPALPTLTNQIQPETPGRRLSHLLTLVNEMEGVVPKIPALPKAPEHPFRHPFKKPSPFPLPAILRLHQIDANVETATIPASTMRLLATEEEMEAIATNDSNQETRTSSQEEVDSQEQDIEIPSYAFNDQNGSQLMDRNQVKMEDTQLMNRNQAKMEDMAVLSNEDAEMEEVSTTNTEETKMKPIALLNNVDAKGKNKALDNQPDQTKIEERAKTDDQMETPTPPYMFHDDGNNLMDQKEVQTENNTSSMDTEATKKEDAVEMNNMSSKIPDADQQDQQQLQTEMMPYMIQEDDEETNLSNQNKTKKGPQEATETDLMDSSTTDPPNQNATDPLDRNMTEGQPQDMDQQMRTNISESSDKILDQKTIEALLTDNIDENMVMDQQMRTNISESSDKILDQKTIEALLTDNIDENMVMDQQMRTNISESNDKIPDQKKIEALLSDTIDENDEVDDENKSDDKSQQVVTAKPESVSIYNSYATSNDQKSTNSILTQPTLPVKPSYPYDNNYPTYNDLKELYDRTPQAQPPKQYGSYAAVYNDLTGRGNNNNNNYNNDLTRSGKNSITPSQKQFYNGYTSYNDQKSSNDNTSQQTQTNKHSGYAKKRRNKDWSPKAVKKMERLDEQYNQVASIMRESGTTAAGWHFLLPQTLSPERRLRLHFN